MIKKEKLWLKNIGRILIVVSFLGVFIGLSFLLMWLKSGDNFMSLFTNPTRQQTYEIVTNFLASAIVTGNFYWLIYKLCVIISKMIKKS